MHVRKSILGVVAAGLIALTGAGFSAYGDARDAAGIEARNASGASDACWDAVDAALAAGAVDVRVNC